MPKLFSDTLPGLEEDNRLGEDSEVTTLMLHGIPARKKMHALFPVFEELGFPMESFDYFYMPHRHNSRGAMGNFGYMFLNCTSPDIAKAFAKAIHHHPLGRTQESCEKVCCAAAEVQGLKANVENALSTGGSVKNFVLVRDGTDWHAIHLSKPRQPAVEAGLPPLPVAAS
jgi:hypothetical protein